MVKIIVFKFPAFSANLDFTTSLRGSYICIVRMQTETGKSSDVIKSKMITRKKFNSDNLFGKFL